MQATLIHLPSTPRHRRVAALAAMLVLLAAIVVGPHAARPGPVVPSFLPMFATWVTLTEGLTALLLWTQYCISGRLLFAALAGAYAFTSVIAALQLAVFPGVFAPAGLFGAGPQTAVHLWLFWHLGFPALVAASLVTRHPRSDKRSYAAGQATIGASIALALAAFALATAGHGLLPAFVSHSGSYARLSDSPVGIAVLAVGVAALLLHTAATRLRSLMDLWLAIALLGALVDAALTLWAGARFSFGWYAARVASMVSSSAVLGVLIYETTGLYRTLSETHLKLVEASARDGLTGVYNRAYFDERYPNELAAAARSASPLCVLMVDVDHFKSFNDTFGHPAGDHCLTSVARTLASSLRRSSDFVARYGGEEFVVVLAGCEADAGSAMADALRHAVANLQLTGTAAGERRVTVSIGLACTSARQPRSGAELLAAADAALYRAKAAGRNQVASEPAAGVRVAG